MSKYLADLIGFSLREVKCDDCSSTNEVYYEEDNNYFICLDCARKTELDDPGEFEDFYRSFKTSDLKNEL